MMNLDVSTIVGYEPTFELNEFDEPRIRSEIEVVKDIILFILFSKEGSYPSLPWIGMDISNYLYSFYDEIDEVKMKEDLIEQCEALGVYFDSSMLAIKKTMYRKQPSLMIHINGKESYPKGYLRSSQKNINSYLIGLTYNEVQELLCNINTEFK